MFDPNKLFNSEANNFLNTMTIHASKAGFKVPDYQRTYDWNQNNLERLMDDCLNGFFHLAMTSKNQRIPYTFLGTIILVEEKDTKEGSFAGTSLSIVDGQQRLTSLVLLCCALIEKIKKYRQSIKYENFNHETKEWLESEVEGVLNSLRECTHGSLPPQTKPSLYPRIVRTGDARGVKQNAEYQSTIGRFLMKFSEADVEDSVININDFFENLKEAQVGRLIENYRSIQALVEKLELSSGASDSEQVARHKFKQWSMIHLFQQLHGQTQQDQNRILNKIAGHDEGKEVENLIRIILFSSYLLHCVVLTRVETQDEESAFDIFDSLNTTGEPLTALETLKPLVVKFENNTNDRKYEGSNSQNEFERIDENLNDVIEDISKRQRETKELLTSFALFLDGEKLTHALSAQRRYLRSMYSNRIQDRDLKVKFVKSIADIAEFRHQIWVPDGKRESNLEFANVRNSDIAKLCFSLLRDMKHNLAIPIIARYWYDDSSSKNEDELVLVLKALTAFVALRRAATGGTALIDNDFRQIMKGAPNSAETPLCLGLNFNNELWSVDTLKEILLQRLSSVIKPSNLELCRSSWVQQAKSVGLYQSSTPLCRFLLLASMHQSKPDTENPGLLTREGVVQSDELNYLHYHCWRDDKYQTVEHVAPGEFTNGWPVEIYSLVSKPHTIGNLTLLPTDENSRVSNAVWGRKRILYQFYSARSEDVRQTILDEVIHAQFNISDAVLEKLKDLYSFPILESLSEVDHWSAELIDRRSQNLLELAWDVLYEWLVPGKN